MNGKTVKRLRFKAKHFAKKEELPITEYKQVVRKINGKDVVTDTIVLTRCERKIYKEMKKFHKGG